MTGYKKHMVGCTKTMVGSNKLKHWVKLKMFIFDPTMHKNHPAFWVETTQNWLIYNSVWWICPFVTQNRVENNPAFFRLQVMIFKLFKSANYSVTDVCVVHFIDHFAKWKHWSRSKFFWYILFLSLTYII